MKTKTNYQYYVEGEDEQKLLNTLKSQLRSIQIGKVDKFNVIQKRFNIARIRTLKQGTVVVLVYDTDIENISILRENISFLRKQTAVKNVICIPQVNNLEDELLRSCQISVIGELTRSRTKKDFKRDLIRCTNLGERLKICSFDISKFWNCIPKNKFSIWGNDAYKIKIGRDERQKI